MKLRQALLFAFAAPALLSCRPPAPTPVFADGELSPAAPNLRRLERSGFALAWLLPDISLASYNAVHLAYPDLRYRTPPRHSSRGALGHDNYSLSDGFTRELRSALEQSFHNEIAAASGWRPSAKREADLAEQTLEVRVSLVDLIVEVPLTQLAGDTLVFVESIGAITVVIDIYDAATRRPVARFADRRSISPVSGRTMQATPGPSLYEARRVFRLWARSLRLALVAIEAASASPAALATPVPTR